jgi:hypothetical protein
MLIHRMDVTASWCAECAPDESVRIFNEFAPMGGAAISGEATK